MKYVQFFCRIFQFLISIVTFLWHLRNPKRLMDFRFGIHNHKIWASDLPGVQKWYRFGQWLSQNHLVRFGRSMKFKVPGTTLTRWFWLNQWPNRCHFCTPGKSEAHILWLWKPNRKSMTRLGFLRSQREVTIEIKNWKIPKHNWTYFTTHIRLITI